MKKITEFLTNHIAIIVALCVIEAFISVWFVLESIYNVAAFISIILNFTVVFRLVCRHFGGDAFFIKDPLWNSLKSKGKSHQYRNLCLDIAASALVFATVSFLVATALFFGFLFVF